jgi:prevent-host-death family protein
MDHLEGTMTLITEETIGVTEFKPRSLELVERVASGKIGRIVLTRRGRPVAALVPVGEPAGELFGALRHLMEPVPGVDLTAPTGEEWDALRD